jgi:hypothetical protein
MEGGCRCVGMGDERACDAQNLGLLCGATCAYVTCSLRPHALLLGRRCLHPHPPRWQEAALLCELRRGQPAAPGGAV